MKSSCGEVAPSLCAMPLHCLPARSPSSLVSPHSVCTARGPYSTPSVTYSSPHTSPSPRPLSTPPSAQATNHTMQSPRSTPFLSLSALPMTCSTHLKDTLISYTSLSSSSHYTTVTLLHHSCITPVVTVTSSTIASHTSCT